MNEYKSVAGVTRHASHSEYATSIAGVLAAVTHEPSAEELAGIVDRHNQLVASRANAGLLTIRFRIVDHYSPELPFSGMSPLSVPLLRFRGGYVEIY